MTQFFYSETADIVEWILVHFNQLPDLLHYLDDFITVSPLSRLSVHTT